MKKKQPVFDPTNAAKLIPGQVDTQKDCMGRPIKIGDRVDDTTAYVGGVVVAVFGEALILMTDSDGDFGIGRFAYANCDEVRLLPPVVNIETTVADLLAYRDALGSETSSIPKVSARPQPVTPCTHIDAANAKDANDQPIRPGDTVLGTDEVISSGFPVGGVVVAVAGEAILIRYHDGDCVRYEGVAGGRYVVQPRTKGTK